MKALITSLLIYIGILPQTQLPAEINQQLTDAIMNCQSMWTPSRLKAEKEFRHLTIREAQKIDSLFDQQKLETALKQMSHDHLSDDERFNQLLTCSATLSARIILDEQTPKEIIGVAISTRKQLRHLTSYKQGTVARVETED